MAYSSADKRRVFLAYRTVFIGPHAQIRKSKKVKEVIEQHKNSFKPLIKDFGFDHVAEIVKYLLDQRVFESELRAKIAFPELFQTSQARDIQRTASENDAARSVAEALEELASTGERGEYENDLEPAAKGSPSLYPSYLPYKAQHIILTTVQRQLEECCFDYAVKWLPSLLEEQKWDCAEAVELTKWTRILAKRCDKLPASAIDNDSEIPLEKVFFSTNVLRHTAVHRLSTTARATYDMIQSASRLAQTLGDHTRAAELENLQLEIGSRIRDMELNKNFLENRLDEQLQVISEQRAELDRKEKEAIATMLQDDQENKLLIGSFLEDAVKITFRRLGDGGPGASKNKSMVENPESAEESGDTPDYQEFGARLSGAKRYCAKSPRTIRRQQGILQRSCPIPSLGISPLLLVTVKTPKSNYRGGTMGTLESNLYLGSVSSPSPELLKPSSSKCITHQVRPVDPSLGFLDIPREIRDEIYGFLFHSDSPIYPSNSRAGISPFTSLLRTNKQIYAEAVEVLYGSNTFQIRGDPAWKSVELLNLVGTQTRNDYTTFRSQVCLGRHHLKRLYIPSHGIGLDRLKHIFSLLKHFPNLEYLEVVYLGLSPKLDMDVVSVCRLLWDRRPLFANFGGNFVLRKRINYYQAEDVSWMVRERPYTNWTRIVEDENRLHVWKNSDGIERLAEVVDAPQNIPE
ncbi:uncharacterized protein BP5553_00932 [Venustampulla echinocandica]|uniref:F-box domain-containing protein n=1 Tax=Venustampulla echinocandica TaxID=2656787 RepID=A0A370TZJ2_9HELO|nr:uncharacterized protein BP5553_00932 [Venustampulla echinocandica]RDL40953.1 hypothetical protein BP5553_00932 [Venustampulla echinocandica]